MPLDAWNEDGEEDEEFIVGLGSVVALASHKIHKLEPTHTHIGISSRKTNRSMICFGVSWLVDIIISGLTIFTGMQLRRRRKQGS